MLAMLSPAGNRRLTAAFGSHHRRAAAHGQSPAGNRRLTAALVLVVGALPCRGQGPELHAAFAAERHGDTPPAMAWLRHQALPQCREWPRQRRGEEPFTLHYRNGKLTFGDALPLPPGLTIAGQLVLDGVTVSFAGAGDGRETWDVEGSALPTTIASLIDSLHLAADAMPRTIDLPALLGNLIGPSAEGDTNAQLLVLGATQCGELTVVARRDQGALRIRGRSGGGLLVPAGLLWLALQRDGAQTPADAANAWRLRAFGSRDGDRAEAARQLPRAGAEALLTLRALLHADEHSRLSAIDGLLRLAAAGELPRIVAAADAEMPLTVPMARTAVRELWGLACASTRLDTLAALRRSPVLDESIVPAILPTAEPVDPRFRWFGALTVTFTGLLGLWLRERLRPL